MNAPLYSPEILRLALGAAMHPRLDAPHGSAEARTPTCGSRILLDVALTPGGDVARVGMDVHACAVGQAAAGILARGAPGRDVGRIRAARAGLAEWLAGDRAVVPDWPGIEALVAARAYPARHAALLLPFDAAMLALVDAGERRIRAA